jgi:hypothetical protein
MRAQPSASSSRKPAETARLGPKQWKEILKTAGVQGAQKQQLMGTWTTTPRRSEEMVK